MAKDKKAPVKKAPAKKPEPKTEINSTKVDAPKTAPAPKPTGPTAVIVEPKPAPSPKMTSLTIRPLFELLWRTEAVLTTNSLNPGIIPLENILKMWNKFTGDVLTVCEIHGVSVPSFLAVDPAPVDEQSVFDRITEVRRQAPQWLLNLNVALPRPAAGNVHVEK